MISDFAKSSFDFLKLPPRYLAAIAIVARSLLFFPTLWLEKIALKNFSNDYQQWLGLAFVVSTTLWAIAIALGGWKKISDKLFQRAVRKKVIRRLSSLTEDEKQILRYYLAKNTRANTLKMDDGVVQGLASNRIIYLSSRVGDMLEGFAYNITDFAWEYLHANQDLLIGTTNTYRTDKRDRNW